MEVSGQLHAPAALPSGKEPLVPIGKLSLCYFQTEHHALKAYWGSGGITTHSSTSTLDGDEWSALRPGRFTPRETALGTH
jgi:hypothetical protein